MKLTLVLLGVLIAVVLTEAHRGCGCSHHHHCHHSHEHHCGHHHHHREKLRVSPQKSYESCEPRYERFRRPTRPIPVPIYVQDAAPVYAAPSNGYAAPAAAPPSPGYQTYGRNNAAADVPSVPVPVTASPPGIAPRHHEEVRNRERVKAAELEKFNAEDFPAPGEERSVEQKESEKKQ